jgi:hypothetical protein
MDTYFRKLLCATVLPSLLGLRLFGLIQLLPKRTIITILVERMNEVQQGARYSF